jgi:hypothetical protein
MTVRNCFLYTPHRHGTDLIDRKASQPPETLGKPGTPNDSRCAPDLAGVAAGLQQAHAGLLARHAPVVDVIRVTPGTQGDAA